MIFFYLLHLSSLDQCKGKRPTKPDGRTIKYRSDHNPCGGWLQCLGGYPKFYFCAAPYSVFSILAQVCVNPRDAKPP